MSDNNEIRLKRCCMCPNRNTPEHRICPAWPPAGQAAGPCGFVRSYQDKDGHLVMVVSYGSAYFSGRRGDELDGADRIKSRSLPTRPYFDWAQEDLNFYAIKKGWAVI